MFDEQLFATASHGPDWDRAWNAEDPHHPGEYGDEPNAGKLLRSVEARGKRLRKFKLESLAISKALHSIGRESESLRMQNCCVRVQRHVHEKGSRLSFRNSRLCKHFLCSACAMRKAARRLKAFVGFIRHYLEKTRDRQAIMIVLTLKNFTPEGLEDGLNHLMKSFARFIRRVKVQRAADGAYFKVNETTINKEREDCFHVHIHLVIFVNRDLYFSAGSPIYLTHAQWRAEWKAAARLDYDPMVNVQVLRGVCWPLGPEGERSLAEPIGYLLKPGTIVEVVDGDYQLIGSDKLMPFDAGDGRGVQLHWNAPLRAMLAAFRHRRMLSTSKELQQLETAFDADDDADDLESTDEREAFGVEDLGTYLFTEVYAWRSRGAGGDFFLIGRFVDRSQEGSAMPP